MKGTPTLLSLAVGLALASRLSTPPASVARPTVPSPPSPPSRAVATRAPRPGRSVRKRPERLGQGGGLGSGRKPQQGLLPAGCAGGRQPETSDGIFVYLNDKNFASKYPDIQPGALVCLEAKVEEYYGHTQLKPLFDGSTPRLTTLAQGAAPAATALRVLEGKPWPEPWNVTKGCGCASTPTAPSRSAATSATTMPPGATTWCSLTAPR